MKRHGFLIEKVIAEDNLSSAFDAVMKKKKRSRTVRYYQKNRTKVLKQIAYEIESDIYEPSRYTLFTLQDRKKERQIISLPFKDRIALHAVMSVMDDIIGKSLIRDTYSSIKSRGIHDGLSRVKKALTDRDGTEYCLKIDLEKYYPSIDQNVLIEMLKGKIKDSRMLNTLTRIIRTYDKGLPIGFHSSQFLGNFYLSSLDHYIKGALGVKYYFRYCDDIVILSSSKEELREILGKVRIYAENILHLMIKDNFQIFPVDARGVDFLGYVIRHDYVLIRKHIKQTAAKKLSRVKSRKRRVQIVGALWGWVKHANGRNLAKKLLNMKDFKELGITYKPTDGKKRFEGELVRLGELQNTEVVIHDFETDITTKEGEGRYVVQFTLPDDEVKKKFITNSEEMKNILDQIRAGDSLPFKTVIKRVFFGQGKSKYVFS
ncbi:RNA-directed DNA polymerase [Parabacteroides sp. PF5-9]|uniref:RNA-directed DNA polymerase n=1 Tax=Parabacteroides sp. PF5-9 TaxID=1742404 RepID=UPI0024744F46|nr:RNA-directed DNA polymerase [Parabacteroides sp. PF5-9]MDH6357250.1 RNA-directed DNA polymerase [Parabacteroides sp. PF5-9]